jgi:hypothetical protein
LNNLSDLADAGTARLNIHIAELAVCQVAATANVTLSGLQTIDGYTTLASDLVLCAGQTTGSQNGPWLAASGAWTRPHEYASAASIVAGRTVSVVNGTVNGPSRWILKTAGTVTVDTTATVWGLDLPPSVVTDSQLTVYPYPGIYVSLNAAVTAANAGGGGIVRLPAGATPVGPKLTMLSGVTIEGPDLEWSVTSNVPMAWLVGDSSTTDPIVEFPTTCVRSGLRNIGVLGTGTNRQGVVLDFSSTVRGGNRLRNVEVYGCGSVSNPAVYVGQLETRMCDLFVYYSVGDGLIVDAPDCQLDTFLCGFNGGNGIVTTANSGVLRGATWDVFDNGLDGIVLNGAPHRLTSIESNNNQQRGVNFHAVQGAVLTLVGIQNNSRAGAGLYADVEFTHPTTGNIGCSIVGGTIGTSDGLEAFAVATSEAVFSHPELIGIWFFGTFPGGSGPSGILSGVTAFNSRGCYGLPDLVVSTSGGNAGMRFRANTGAGDQISFTTSAGAAQAGIKNSGALYLPVVAQTLAAPGAVTIDASASNIAAVTLGANASSSSITNPTTGQFLTIEWIQDGTGGRTYVWPANVVFAGASTPIASVAANARDSVTFRYDGTNWQEVASAAFDARYAPASNSLLVGATRESVPRQVAGQAITTVGTIFYASPIAFFPGDVIANLHFFNSGTALTNGSSASHLWAAVYTLSGTTLTLVLQSTDNAAATWALKTWLKCVLTAPIVVSVPIVYYCGLFVAAGTGGSPVQPTAVADGSFSSVEMFSAQANQPAGMLPVAVAATVTPGATAPGSVAASAIIDGIYVATS